MDTNQERTLNDVAQRFPIFIYSILFIFLGSFFLSPAHADPHNVDITPVKPDDFVDFGHPDTDKVALGKFLFFDKILSGNKNISCATCHHALTDTGDGLSLPIGEGGRGLGVIRDTGTGADRVHERVPRNAPPVFALGARSITDLFHDGRVAIDENQESGFLSPAGDDLPLGLENVLAAQAMFPVTSGTEMAGQAGENPIADVAAAGALTEVWEQLADRLRAIPEYADLFQAAFGISASEITYAHAANAIAAFEISAWRATNSPFDQVLHGDRSAMSRKAIKGMRLFYGKAKCGTCHSGPFQTDMNYHAIAMPQIGPGKGDGFDGHEDFGRERVTGEIEDRYRFRTPPLRNVALTGPWGHDGAFNTLEGVVRHHLNPIKSIMNYECPGSATLPSRPDLDALDCIVQNDIERVRAIGDANTLRPQRLKEKEIKALLAFLHALTDPGSLDLRADVPTHLPSGLSLVE
ncbi:Methylamine utilization protein mauG precursor [hydrothermal vent metagenome]|uniref:Methylamine utilization protein mauG n=1 Tax=hydrothermal vent metagenome TaxID=652676 RepID=A0A3B1DFH4_9ZZZZ